MDTPSFLARNAIDLTNSHKDAHRRTLTIGGDHSPSNTSGGSDLSSENMVKGMNISYHHKQVLNPRELGIEIGRSLTWVNERANDGTLPSFRVGTRIWFKRADLVAAGFLTA